MIDFELTPEDEAAIKAAHQQAEELLRPVSRYYDEHEHESPQELIDTLWNRSSEGGGGGMLGREVRSRYSASWRVSAGASLRGVLWR